MLVRALLLGLLADGFAVPEGLARHPRSLRARARPRRAAAPTELARGGGATKPPPDVSKRAMLGFAGPALGIFLATACGLVDMASFQFAPQSLLAPFGALGLIVNLLLAAPMHGDRVTRFDLASTVLTVSGVAACLSSAATAMPAYSLDELAALARRPRFLGYLAAQGLVLAVAFVRVRAGGGNAFCYALPAGLLVGATVLAAKLLGELVRHGVPLLGLAGMGCLLGAFGVTQVTILNAGLGKHSPLLLMPIFVATTVVANACGGGLFFDEWATMSAEAWRNYLSGVAMLLSGVLCLTLKPADKGKAD